MASVIMQKHCDNQYKIKKFIKIHLQPMKKPIRLILKCETFATPRIKKTEEYVKVRSPVVLVDSFQ